MADPVRILTVGTNGELYAGGAFTNTGSLSVGRFAKWNGSIWTNQPAGMNGYVISLAVTNNELYAGGTFTIAGGVGANQIAKWNGSNWTNLGNGMNATVKVTVTWSAASVASGYQVWRNTADISSSATQIGTAAQTNYDDTSAIVGVLYYYWVKATNAYGASAFSASPTAGAPIFQRACAPITMATAKLIRRSTTRPPGRGK